MSKIELMAGDNRDHLRRLIEEGVQVHSVVTDPPYGLVSIKKRFGKKGSAAAKSEGNDGSFSRLSGGFMGKAWDGTEIERDPEFWKLVYDVLLPGGCVFAFGGSRTVHWQMVAMEQAGFVIHPMHIWAFGCMDPETEVLTRRGWSKYWELHPEDEVLQWHSETGALTWVVPEAVHEYPFDGEMIVLENRNTRQVLTPNHRVYAKVRRHSRNAKPTEYEVLTADAIEDRPVNWSVDLPLAGKLLNGASVDPDYAYLVGWWLTDAWSHRDANACCFSQCKPETLAKLREALSPYRPSEYVKKAQKETHSDEHTFYLTGPMADRLRSEFPDRALCWSVLGWDGASRRKLFEGLMDGDGSQPKAGANGLPSYSHTFWSKDQERRDVFMALTLSLGMRCHEDAEKGAVYLNTHRDTTQLQSKHRQTRMPHTGQVWCLTVPTGAFVVRREGKPFITGNSGFPKAHAADKAIDKALGAERQVVGVSERGSGAQPNKLDNHGKGDTGIGYADGSGRVFEITRAATPEAQQWEGWAYGTQTQKPALEPIVLAQKPFSEKTGAANLLKHGVGAFNIDGCRVPTEAGGRPLLEVAAMRGDVEYNGVSLSGRADGSLQSSKAVGSTDKGRHPANLIHDGSPEVVAMFPDSKGQLAKASERTETRKTQNCYGAMSHGSGGQEPRGDDGSAARFFNCFPQDADPIFYNPKANKKDRAGSKHPTVKPVALLQHLIRHITPPGGTVLDPFAGSGTTAEAARREGFDCILMEQEDEYLDFLRERFPDCAERPS